jgi:hypothetical protein
MKQCKPTSEQVVSDFVQGCGLRREELKWLGVADFYQKHPRRFCEQHWIHIDTFRGLLAHEVPFMDEYAWTIALVCQEKDPSDLVFPVLPDLDYEALRLSYARELFILRYESLGAAGGPQTLHEVGQMVKQALGLTRLDPTLQKWLRQARRDLAAEYM